MRIDHFAFQRATKVAGFGLLLQAIIGLLLLVFGLTYSDTAFVFASLYVLPGVLVWLGLIIIFHQHKLERLEALEEDELAATRGGKSTSVFDKAREESRVAQRRLGLMHKWFMPALSVFIAAVLGLLVWRMIVFMNAVRQEPDEFLLTEHRGWAIAICLSVAALSFVFARFVAGMAKQGAWANLRGGAAYMVGNALVLVAVAAGIIFRFFDNNSVIEKIAWAIPIFMLGLALEILLNFVLNLYRPRVPGEVPRPAFDSKALSLLAAPDNIVRSLNEAVNYQFGFDVTSSWGYQLLLRSFVWLAILGVAALVLLSTMVVVEPHQQAVKLRGGKIVGNKVYGSGVMWKWPWPIETAAVYDVSRLRSVWLTPKVKEWPRAHLWSAEAPATDTPLQPFIVGSPAEQRSEAVKAALPTSAEVAADPAGVAATPPTTAPAQPDEAPSLSAETGLPEGQEPTAEDVAVEAVSALYSLVDAEMVLQYRVKSEDGALLKYINFASEEAGRMAELTERDQALRTIALASVSSELSRLSLDDVLSPGRTDLNTLLERKIQEQFDARNTGVEVVALEIPLLRPSGTAAEKFEELGIAVQGANEFIAQAERNVVATYTVWVGDVMLIERVIRGIEEYDALRAQGSPDALAKRQEVEALLRLGGGMAAQVIENAERDRWVKLMEHRTQASSVQNQLAAYRAAPELFRQREIMRVYAQMLPGVDKFVLGIDPSRVLVDMDLKKVNPILDFAGVSEEEAQHQ
jgi:modulator of FtsH protease HflK